MVATVSLIQELQRRGVGRRLVHWPRGVDDELFHPAKRRDDVYDYPRPVWLYVGRVAVEKSLEDFLSLDLPGTKVVVELTSYPDRHARAAGVITEVLGKAGETDVDLRSVIVDRKSVV